MLSIKISVVTLFASWSRVAASAATFDAKLNERALFFCKASYCEEEEVEDWTCPICSADLKEVEDITTLVVPDTEIKSFVGYDPAIESVVLTFRGSSNTANWAVNFQTALTDYPHCGAEKCQCHKGFYEAWEKNTAILDPIADLVKKHSAKRVLITGHSLGAAMATFAALHLQREGSSMPPIEVYHFGSPRVGDLNFVKHVVETLPVFFRVTHHRDPIPHVPANRDGYVHIPHEIFYHERTGLEFKSCNDQPADISTAKPEDFEDPTCADQYSFDIAWADDHVYYLDMCTSCDRQPDLNFLGNYCFRILETEDGLANMSDPITRAMVERFQPAL